jgi:hypothetical protein
LRIAGRLCRLRIVDCGLLIVRPAGASPRRDGIVDCRWSIGGLSIADLIED